MNMKLYLKIYILFFLLFFKIAFTIKAQTVEPTWESMAEHYNVPEWFQDGKIGVWMHWGIPSSIDENRPNDGSHYGRRMYGPNDGEQGKQLEMTTTLSNWHKKTYGDQSKFGYEDFIPNFKGENFDADALVKFVKDCGAKFVMPVATHHDNFDMYDSFHPWNSVKMGPKRDIIQEWKDAAYKHGLKFGVSTHLYWSPSFFKQARKYQKEDTPEWTFFNMEYDVDNYKKTDKWNEHWYARCWELIEKYDPDMFNNDSPYPKIGSGKGLGVKLFTQILGKDLKENNGKQTTVISFKDGSKDKSAFTYNLERGMSGEIQKYPWMWATDLSGSWFYRKNSFTRMSTSVLLGNAIDAISKNGIVMINLAQKGDGSLPNNQRKVLEDFGAWVKTNQEGIYGTRPWKIFGEGPLKIETRRTGENLLEYSQKDIRFTTKNGNLFVYILGKASEDIIIKSLNEGGLLDKKIEKISLMGSSENIKWTRNLSHLKIQLPKNQPNHSVIGFKLTLI